MLKFSSLVLILINTQSSSFSIAFCLSISLLRLLSTCPNSSISVDQSCSLKQCIEFGCLLLQMHLLLFLSINYIV